MNTFSEPFKSAVSYEEKWIKAWEESKVFEADPNPSKPKFFITFPYSYPDGPLHVGGAFTATRADVYARFKRMQGYNVLFPWAWHWTGMAASGMSKRLEAGDEVVFRLLRDVDKVPEELIPKFKDPVFMISFYTKENRRAVISMGFSVDWRREFHTTDLHPYYSRFIEWQYRKLKEKGYVTKGTHPVVWCPKCNSPTGDHDRLVGEGVGPEEFTVVLFKFGDLYLAAATLRPETIYGTTNLWIKSGQVYSVLQQRGKKIVVSKECVEKFKDQLGDVKEVASIKSEEIIGKVCKVPITDKDVLILPARFVDTSVATGIVYSVPAHAPYDYVALEEVKQRYEEVKQYGIDKKTLDEIMPISIIEVIGYGECPAEEEVKKLGIKDQLDQKLEEATREVYLREFYHGKMRHECEKVAGLTIPEARQKIKEELGLKGLALSLFDLPSKVVCRSGDVCTVKLVKDQWFLAYSKEEWKEEVKDHISRMNIVPKEARQWFLNTVDWLKDWACTRKTGLGTSLPWDRSWIVETLSDSTVYMALYTISKYLNLGLIPPDKIEDEVLDFIFLGKGDLNSVSSKYKIPTEVLRSMRDEFLYWYPVDIRISAKELVPNHLTFYIFHHVALFPKELWPRGISVNGWMKVEGQKMSKSKGNVVTIKEAVEKYGADATRCTLMLAAEDMDDPDWREKNVKDMSKHLSSLLSVFSNIASSHTYNDLDYIDKWLISKLNKRIKEVTQALDNMKTRTSCNIVVYDMYNDWKWYLRRKGSKVSNVAKEFVKAWVKMLAPFAPFTAEEAWSLLDGKSFVSLAKWPIYDESNIDMVIELSEDLIKRLIDDVRNIIEVTGKKPKKAVLYTPASWKVELARTLVNMGIKEALREKKKAIKLAIQSIPEKKSEIPSIINNILDILASYSKEYSEKTIGETIYKERDIYEKALSFLKSQFECEVDIVGEEEGFYDPIGKAKHSLPLRPAIYLDI